MSSNNKTLVQLNNAGFRQNGKWLVEGVSLKVEKGKIVTLIGPNGSGKSTTAKIALGIYKNIEGNVEKYTNKIGYVPQKISIDWTLPLRVYDFMLLTENINDDAIDEALNLHDINKIGKIDIYFPLSSFSTKNISYIESFLSRLKDEYITPGKLKWGTQRAVYDAYTSLIDAE